MTTPSPARAKLACWCRRSAGPRSASDRGRDPTHSGHRTPVQLYASPLLMARGTRRSVLVALVGNELVAGAPNAVRTRRPAVWRSATRARGIRKRPVRPGHPMVPRRRCESVAARVVVPSVSCKAQRRNLCEAHAESGVSVKLMLSRFSSTSPMRNWPKRSAWGLTRVIGVLSAYRWRDAALEDAEPRTGVCQTDIHAAVILVVLLEQVHRQQRLVVNLPSSSRTRFT